MRSCSQVQTYGHDRERRELARYVRQLNVGESKMSRWFEGWFGYGLGKAARRAIFEDERRVEDSKTTAPFRSQTEAEIQADERRYDEDAKRLEAEDRAERAARRRAK
jgi:hypothetical protein